MAKVELSRREFLILSGLTLLTACTLRRPETLVYEEYDKEHNILFVNELDQINTKVNWETFLKTSDFFDIPISNFSDFNIKITKKSLSIDPRFGFNEHVQTDVINNHGFIEIAGGSIFKAVDEAEGPYKTKANTDFLLGVFLSHSAFVGYNDLASMRGLISENESRENSLAYINLVINSFVYPIITASIKEENFQGFDV